MMTIPRGRPGNEFEKPALQARCPTPSQRAGTIASEAFSRAGRCADRASPRLIWRLFRGKSLAPVVAMSETAARIGAANLVAGCLANGRDELGQLALTFNQLLAWLMSCSSSNAMADASHDEDSGLSGPRRIGNCSLS